MGKFSEFVITLIGWLFLLWLLVPAVFMLVGLWVIVQGDYGG